MYCYSSCNVCSDLYRHSIYVYGIKLKCGGDFNETYKAWPEYRFLCCADWNRLYYTSDIEFLIGFLRVYIAIPLAYVVVYCAYRACRNLYDPECKIEINGKWYIWVCLFVLVVLWIYFSGIGSFSFQNGDHIVRNPIFRDLINYKWPVIYDLSKMSQNITSITGTDKVMFVYYFAYWLPSAVVGKIFGEAAANVALYL